jgi:hypothetical protein
MLALGGIEVLGIHRREEGLGRNVRRPSSPSPNFPLFAAVDWNEPHKRFAGTCNHDLLARQRSMEQR